MFNCIADAHQADSIDNRRHYHRSIGYVPKHQRPLATDNTSNASNRGHGESHSFSYDEATLRQLLLEYVIIVFCMAVCSCIGLKQFNHDNRFVYYLATNGFYFEIATIFHAFVLYRGNKKQKN